MPNTTAQQIIDFMYEHDLVDSDEGEPLCADEHMIQQIYELATDPGWVPQHEDLKRQLVEMINGYWRVKR